MNAKKQIEEYFKSSASATIVKTIEEIAEQLNVDSLEVLSIDRVKIASFNEIKEYGQLYYCNFSSPFFCMTNLSIHKKEIYKVIVRNIFMNPTVFHIISLAFIKKEDESLILFIFTENKTEIIYDLQEKSISLKDFKKIA